jgi:integrase
MPRPRKDGTPARGVQRRKLTDLFVQSRKGGERNEMIWDERCPHLALSVRTTGYKSWTVIYRHGGRPQWLLLGDARYIGLADARRLAARVMLDVAEGKDPALARRAQRDSGTFAEVAAQYVELHAKKHNKSWKTTEKLVARYVLPSLGKLKASAIVRADLRAMMLRLSEAPITANQALASASAIFSWAAKQEILTVNPCHGVDRNPTNDRERVLTDAELTTLWPRCEPALKLLLLTAQRPGEVAAMQADHIVEGFWRMPGKPSGAWPGTKNVRDHRVALSGPALEQVELHLAHRASAQMSSLRLKKLVAEFGLENVTPHDFRRTALSTITGLGFSRDAMDRIANHKKGGITDVYDRHSYAEEDKRIMAAVARHILGLVEGKGSTNVVALR